MPVVIGAMLLVVGWCQEARITGYVRTDHGSQTADGTSIYTDEAIAAASWNIPLQSKVWVEDIGTFRVADRGSGLGSSGWVDIAVWTRSEALALTSTRPICVAPPEDAAWDLTHIWVHVILKTGQ